MNKFSILLIIGVLSYSCKNKEQNNQSNKVLEFEHSVNPKGSTIVYISEFPLNNSNLMDRIKDEEFPKIDLFVLTSLDFAIISEKNSTKWESENNPVVIDEENGYAIIHISKTGLNSVINYKGELENMDKETQNIDLNKLKEFANKYGSENLYEVVTF